MNQSNSIDWKQTALSNPNIQAWYKQLRSQYPEEPENILEHMEDQIRRFSGGKGEGYDYKGAIEHGIYPQYVPELGEYHWGSQEPDTKRWLKGEKHETRKLAEQFNRKEFLKKARDYGYSADEINTFLKNKLENKIKLLL